MFILQRHMGDWLSLQAMHPIDRAVSHLRFCAAVILPVLRD
ncbi:MAG: hypothetical protein WA777_20035 [Rhodanobacter sp.]